MISSAIWDKSARVNFSDLSQIVREKSCDYLLIIHIKKISLEVDDKQNVFSGLPFRFVLKHNGVAGLCKMQIPLGNFKSLCHALSGAFILIQFYWFGLKCPTSIFACNLYSLRAVA